MNNIIRCNNLKYSYLYTMNKTQDIKYEHSNVGLMFHILAFSLGQRLKISFVSVGEDGQELPKWH